MRRRDLRALRRALCALLAMAALALAHATADGDQEPVAGAADVSTPAVESWTTEAVLGAAGAAANTSSSSTSGTMARMQESRRAQRLQARRQWPSSRGWSTWSDWSTCSRTCDGGASYQLRRCKSPAGCRGEAMRYKICNMQPCMDSVDFRAQQCEAWNREPRRGRFYRWTPHHDEDRPCALVCRGEPVLDTAGDAPADGDIPGDTLPRQRRRRRRGRHNRAGDRDDDDDEEEDEDDEDAGADEDGDEDEERVDAGGRPVVEVLAPKAQDGTRCRPGSLDMCINGKCQHVGCDLRLGSQRAVDACGVCGGDGSTCATPLYHWDTVPSSLCSEACGGGYRSASHVCKNRVTGLEVEDALCDQSRRPQGEVEPCNTHRCPAKWIAEAWEMCSASCGGGWRHRDVYCAEVIGGNLTKVPDDMCFGAAKPRHKELCGSEKCPTWDSGEWSECSATCGAGIQTRPLTCIDSHGAFLDDTACDPLRQPPLTRACAAAAPCPQTQHNYNSLLGSGEDDDAEGAFDSELEPDPDSDYSDPLLRPYPPLMPAVAERLVGGAGGGAGGGASEPSFVPGPWSECSATCGEGAQHREVHCRVFLEGTKNRARIDDRECPGPKPPEKQPCHGPPCVSTTSRRFVVGDWGPCSSSCGEGVQHREVHCKLFLELSRATTTLKPHQCPGPQPHRTRPCTVSLCPLANTLDSQLLADTAEAPRVGGLKGTFSWKEQGFRECSKSCLGGVQESIISCVRDHDGKTVTPYMCNDPKPETRTRTCNDQPCPPRWNYTEFSKCSDECGMGIKIREVTCIHEVTNYNVVTIPNNRCPQPSPPDRAYCNVLDCQPAWNVSEWSKCSRPCAGGLKTRAVTCTQRMAQNHVVSRPASMCPEHLKPAERRPCNSKPCGPDDHRPAIAANDNTFAYEAKPNQKQVSVKVGGSASIFLGTRLKIRCPVKRFNRSKIAWQKDGKQLHHSKKHHISNKGVLRIMDATLQDSGRYSCVAGQSSADLIVVVKNRPGEFLSSEELPIGQPPQQHPRHRDRQGDTGRVFPGAGDDISHEVSPTGTSRYNMKKKTSPPPETKHQSSNNDRDQGYSYNYNGYGQSSRAPQPGRTTDDYPSTYGNGNWNPAGPSEDESNAIYPDPTASSAAARIRPPLHGLLRHLQTVAAFSFIRQVLSDRLPMSVSTLPPLISQLQQRPAPAPAAPAHHEPGAGAGAGPGAGAAQDPDATTEQAGGPAVLLGKGSAAAAELRFEWIITPWSDCSETCGGSGFQLRAAQCTVRPGSGRNSTSPDAAPGAAPAPAASTQTVDAMLCEDAGLPAPTTFQRCGSEECPRWVAGDWSSCEDSRCFDWNTAMQRRDVECKLPNDTVVEPTLCDESEKPPVRLECYNARCKGTWRVGEWSECAARCGTSGVKHRILQCVWFGTKKAAGNACREQPRPVVMKSCKGPPCGQGGECRDESQYCTTVRAMNLCRLQRYQTQCCLSCQSNRG